MTKPTEEKVTTAKPTEEKVTTAKAKRDSVTVVWQGGSREYTKNEHGEDFEALATEFAEKKKGNLV